MADVRESVAQLGQQFELFITYNDANGRIGSFDWVHTGGGTATCRLSRLAGGWDEVVVPPPGQMARLTRAAEDGSIITQDQQLAGSEDGVHSLNVPGGRTYRRDLTKGDLATGDTFMLDVSWDPIRG